MGRQGRFLRADAHHDAHGRREAIARSAPNGPSCCYGLYARHARGHRRPRDRRRVRSRPRGVGRRRRRRCRAVPGPRARGDVATPLLARDLLPSLDRYAHLIDGDRRVPLRMSRPATGARTAAAIARCRWSTTAASASSTPTPWSPTSRSRSRRAPPHDLRRPRLPQRRAPLTARRRAVHDRVPRPHVRLHCQGRAHPPPRGRVARARRPRLPVRGLRVRIDERRDPRTVRQGSHRGRRRRASRCCARTALRSGPRGCRSRRGRRAETSALFEFVAAHDLVANVDPVQYTIRLLLPRGSLLLDLPESPRASAPTTPIAAPTPGRPTIPRSTSCSCGWPRSSRRVRRRGEPGGDLPGAVRDRGADAALSDPTRCATARASRSRGSAVRSPPARSSSGTLEPRLSAVGLLSTLRAEPARNQAMCSSDIVWVVAISSVVPSAWWSTHRHGAAGREIGEPDDVDVSSTRILS